MNVAQTGASLGAKHGSQALGSQAFEETALEEHVWQIVWKIFFLAAMHTITRGMLIEVLCLCTVICSPHIPATEFRGAAIFSMIEHQQ